MNSDNCIVRYIDEQKGKGLFATRAFQEGEVILVEKPLVSCQFAWNKDCGYLACDNCLKPLETAEENARRLTHNSSIALPHPECCIINKESITECSECGAKYCSTECKNEAFQRYHKSLCLQSRENNEDHPLVQLKDTWKQMHYPPETATIMLIARMVAFVNQAENKEEAISMLSRFCHNTVNSTEDIIHEILTVGFNNDVNLLRDATIKALNTEFMPEWFTENGFRNLLALMATNAQGIGTSSFSIWVKNVSALELSNEEKSEIDKLIDILYEEMDRAIGREFLNNEGSGFYALQSAINHSCVPNAVVNFPYSNSVLVLTASRNIQPEEEIVISYLDECEAQKSRHTRQKHLRRFYLFNCRCEKCLLEADQPDKTSSEESDDWDDDDRMSDH